MPVKSKVEISQNFVAFSEYILTLTNGRQNTISKTARRKSSSNYTSMEQTVSKFALSFLKPITSGNVYIQFVFPRIQVNIKKRSTCRNEFEKYKTTRKQYAETCTKLQVTKTICRVLFQETARRLKGISALSSQRVKSCSPKFHHPSFHW